MWNEQFRLPIPPVDAVAPTAFSIGCAVFYGVCAFAAFIFALMHWRKSGRPIVLLIFVGGGLAVFVETFVDLIGACWHPRLGQTVVFELFGRPIPWWIVAVYFCFWGGLLSVNYLVFARGVSSKVIRLWFLVPMFIEVLIEEIMLAMDLYLYYGYQPLILLWKAPLWWVPCNCIGVFIGATLIVILAPYLRSWKLLLIPLLIPLSEMVGYSAVALPTWIVINKPVSAWVSQLAGICTFLLAFLIIHGITLILATDSPLRKGGGLVARITG